MSTKLKVEFCDPHAGWVDMTIQADADVITLTASYVLFATLTELVDGLHAISMGDDARSIGFFEEPGIFVMCLQSENGAAKLEVSRSSLSSRLKPQGGPLFSATGSTLDVCLPFWRALRRLQTRFSDKEFERRWYSPFPSSGMERLSTSLKSLQERAQRGWL